MSQTLEGLKISKVGNPKRLEKLAKMNFKAVLFYAKHGRETPVESLKVARDKELEHNRVWAAADAEMERSRIWVADVAPRC